MLRSAKSPEHPLSAGKGGVEAGGGPPGSPWSPGARAPAVVAPAAAAPPAAAVAAAATTPAAQPAETARTPTSQASSEQKPTSSKASKDTPSAASATDSAVLPADAAAAIARARAEANAPQQPFASAPIPPAPTPLATKPRAAFEAADANSNGEVSIIEAIKALRANSDFARALGLEPQHVKQEDGSRDKFIRAFGAFDGDGDKRLTFSEFRSGYRALVEEREKEEKQHRRSDRGSALPID